MQDELHVVINFNLVQHSMSINLLLHNALYVHIAPGQQGPVSV